MKTKENIKSNTNDEKVINETFAEITRPLREASKKIREDEVTDFIHRFREEKRKKPNSQLQ